MSWPGLHCRALMPCLWKRDHSELSHCKRWPKGHGLFNFHLLRFCPMAQYTQVCLEKSRFEPCFGCRVGGGGIFFSCFRCRCPPQVGDLRWKFGRNLTAPSNIHLSHTHHLTFKVSNVVLPCRGRAAVNAPKNIRACHGRKSRCTKSGDSPGGMRLQGPSRLTTSSTTVGKPQTNGFNVSKLCIADQRFFVKPGKISNLIQRLQY